jgi:hypothetical protein
MPGDFLPDRPHDRRSASDERCRCPSFTSSLRKAVHYNGMLVNSSYHRLYLWYDCLPDIASRINRPFNGLHRLQTHHETAAGEVSVSYGYSVPSKRESPSSRPYRSFRAVMLKTPFPIL